MPRKNSVGNWFMEMFSGRPEKECFCHFLGIWNSNSMHDRNYIGFRLLWILVTSQQRCLNDLCNGTVCLPGHASWIHFSQSLQKFWRRKVEIKCPSDFNAVSRHCICSFLCYEFGVVV